MYHHNPNQTPRKKLRLKNYDYSKAGLYFITISVQNKLCLFWKIENNKMEIFESGEMIEKLWFELENKFDNIKLHNFVVMPNHFHGILEIVEKNEKSKNIVNNPVGADLCVCPDDGDLCHDIDNVCPDGGDLCHDIDNVCPDGGDLCYDIDNVCPDGGDLCHDIDNVCPDGGDLCHDIDNVCLDNGNNIKNNDLLQQSGWMHRFTPTNGEFIYDKKSISSIIQWFKTMTTNSYIKLVHKNKANNFNKKLWQRNFYEHVIRDENEYLKISKYIDENVEKWEEDKFYFTEIY